MKVLIMILCLSLYTQADSANKHLQYEGVTTTYQDKEIFIKRLKHPKCLKVGVTPENIFGGDLVGKEVPKECQKNFIVSLGVVQPMHLDKEVRTVGELEVLKILQLLDFEPEKYILVDARGEHWFEKITIPHAINIPKKHLIPDADFPDDFDDAMHKLGIKKDKKGKLDFSKAKEAIIFCNGAWCTQSAKMIGQLISLGYPKGKLLWYRGGLQDWISMGFTTSKGVTH